jgi:rhodanese-related sulfurtransferase
MVAAGGAEAAGQAAQGDSEKRGSAGSGAERRRFGHPYCGLYCLYSAMKMQGHKVHFPDLVKLEYIGSREGSSLAELKKAAQDNAMHAESVVKLTIQSLCHCPYPVILHVKPEVGEQNYSHFELFLGAKGGSATLFDPPSPPRLVPFRELAARWDRTGLIVSAKPIDLGIILASARKRAAAYVVIFVAGVLIVHWFRARWLARGPMLSRRRLLGLSLAEGVGFAVAALLGGMLYHFAYDDGLLAYADATASVKRAHLGAFIPKIGVSYVRKLLDMETVFVDARIKRDYKSGHFEGAISVPVDCNDRQREEAMGEVAKEVPIVVYCQSAGCKFAEKVAIKLMEDGFSNVSVFKGGWREWTGEADK